MTDDRPLAAPLRAIGILAGLDVPSVGHGRLAVAVRGVCAEIEARVGAAPSRGVRALVGALRRLARRFEAATIDPAAFWEAFGQHAARLDEALAGREEGAAA